MPKRKNKRKQSPRRPAPKKKRVVTDTRTRVTRTTFGSLAKEHRRRYSAAAGRTREWAEARDASLARGDCGGATGALVEFSAAVGRADAEARGAGSGVAAVAREQLAAARGRFTRVCLVPKGRGGPRRG